MISDFPFPEVIDFQEGPGILAKDFRKEGVPLVRLSGLDEGVSVLNGCNYLDPGMVAQKWAHFALREGDILLSTSASLGRVAVVGPEGAGAIPYTGLIRMRPRDERIHAPFIRYLLASQDFQDQVHAAGVGSVIRHFGPMHLRSMRLRFPTPAEQVAIATSLGSIDRNVELNRRISQTLEALAQAIFRSWFVDFEPVQARAGGDSLLGVSNEQMAALPSSLQLLKGLELPTGWTSVGLDAIATYLNGLALQKYPPNDEETLPVIKIAQLRAGHVAGADRAGLDVPEAYIVRDGDVLFSWSGSLEVDIWTGGVGALNQHLFKVTSDTYPKWFYYLWTKQHLSEFRRIAANKATTMGHIQRKHLTEAKVNVPPSGVIDAADRVLAPLLARIEATRLESRSLGELREALLPRLLSGELVVDVEE